VQGGFRASAGICRAAASPSDTSGCQKRRPCQRMGSRAACWELGCEGRWDWGWDDLWMAWKGFSCDFLIPMHIHISQWRREHWANHPRAPCLFLHHSHDPGAFTSQFSLCVQFRFLQEKNCLHPKRVLVAPAEAPWMGFLSAFQVNSTKAHNSRGSEQPPRTKVPCACSLNGD